MDIPVKFVGSMRSLAERQDMHVDVAENTTIIDLLRELRAMLPNAFYQFVLAPLINSTEPGFIIMVNKVPLMDNEALSRLLVDGDQIVFMPPMSGG